MDTLAPLYIPGCKGGNETHPCQFISNMPLMVCLQHESIALPDYFFDADGKKPR
jgi:hypothetical protein